MSQLKIRDVLAPDGIIKDEVLLTRSTTKEYKQRLVYLTNKDLRKAISSYLRERNRNDTAVLRPAAPPVQVKKKRSI